MLKATFLIAALFLCTVVITAENYQMTSTSSPKMLQSLKNFSLIKDNHLDFLSGRPATLGDIRSQMNPALEKSHGSVSDRVGVNFSVALQQNTMNPSQAASLLKQHYPKLQKAKIFVYDKSLIQALVDAGFTHIYVDVPNGEINNLASNPSAAYKICDQLTDHVNNGVQFTIGVSNEPFSNGINGNLVPAFRNLRNVLKSLDFFDAGVKMSVPLALDFVNNSYPPSAGVLKGEFANTVKEIAKMLVEDGGSFNVNIYGFFTLIYAGGAVSRDYAVGKQGANVDGFHFNSVMEASLAAVRASLLKLDSSFTAQRLPFIITEAGWPTSGHAQANVQNAQEWANYAVRSGYNLYLFEAFDEKNKWGGAMEKSFGLMEENGNMKYQIPDLQ